MIQSNRSESGKGGGGLENRLAKLFLNSLLISACTFGGGFVIVTLMKRKYVDELHWLDEGEMLDYTALAQSSPGAIAVNAAVLVGWKVGGLPGMLLAALGTVLPPVLILTLISYFYAAFAAMPLVALILKGMRAGVAAVILDVVLSLGGKLFEGEKVFNAVLLAVAFLLSFLTNLSVIWLILAAVLAGGVRALILKKRRERP